MLKSGSCGSENQARHCLNIRVDQSKLVFFDNHVGRIHLGLKIGLFANIVHGSFQTLYGLDASIKPSYSGRNQKRFFEKTKKEEQSKPKEKKEKDTEGSKRKQSEGESKKPKSNKNKRRRTSK